MSPVEPTAAIVIIRHPDRRKREVLLAHFMELMIVCRATHREIFTVGAVAASTKGKG